MSRYFRFGKDKEDKDKNKLSFQICTLQHSTRKVKARKVGKRMDYVLDRNAGILDSIFC